MKGVKKSKAIEAWGYYRENTTRHFQLLSRKQVRRSHTDARAHTLLARTFRSIV